MNAQPATDDDLKCVDHGVWTALPVSPPDALNAYTLDFAEVDAAENQRIQAAGVMSCHTAGCTGDFSDHTEQQSVAAEMATQLQSQDANVPPASFLFHLGDVVYVDDDKTDPDGAEMKPIYNDQFYAPYTHYGRSILAIAGNHDGKLSPHEKKSAIAHFMLNFCADSMKKSDDNGTDKRPAMTQPYVYWRLETPLAHIIGLYSNIANGGILDDPAHPHDTPQYDWLVAQLKQVQSKNAEAGKSKALILAVHYPPFSGALNFTQRGDPTLGWMQAQQSGEKAHSPSVQPLAAVLQQAFIESGQRPDAVISAHAHLYQRLTYRYADGWQIPYLVAGSGGHAPVENLWEDCSGQDATPQPLPSLPFPAVVPRRLTLPTSDSVQVEAYNDHSQGNNFGFLRLTVMPAAITGEFFTVVGGTPALYDSFCLDLTKHTVQ